MRVKAGNAVVRRALGGGLAALLLLTAGAMAQVAMPRYQSPIEAPTPQVTIPTMPAVTPNGEVVEYPIVRVNDQLIDRSDYERAQQQLLQDAQQENLSRTELEQRQKDLLRDMIDQQLLLSRGKELDINADTESIRQLDEIRKQNKFDSMEDLEKAVRESGVSYEDFKANIKNRIITQQVVRDEVGRKLTLSAKEEQAYYDQHKQDYQQPEQIRLSEILIPTPADATDAQVAQAQATAEEVEGKLKAGAKFEDLAKQYSGGETADKGGDLGEWKRGALAKALEDPTFALKAGEWTAPIRTRQGYVVLKVTEHTEAGVLPLSAVDEQVQQAIYEQAIQPALRVYLTDLREKAYIDIAPGFTDTGASAKETKPVFSAYTPPAVNKKKVEQKERLDQSRSAATAAAVAKPGVATAAAGGGGAGAAVVAASSPAAGSPSAGAKTVAVSTSKKRKKIRREKIRYGQAPRQSLPTAPEETAIAGADQGPGATSAGEISAPGAAITAIDQTVASNADPLAPRVPDRTKTRYADRAAAEEKTKAAAKTTAKVAEKAAAVPTPMTADEKAAAQTQSAALGLDGDTASKKKKTKVKGAAKERLQEQPPTPPAAKPDATPIPPKSIRDNGEPVVAPPPDPSKLPPVAVPAPGAADTQPGTPGNAAPGPAQ